MHDPFYISMAAELGELDLHDLFRFAAPTHDVSKLRQSLLVKQLSEPARRFTGINELSEFLDDREYEHSNAALSIIFSYKGEDLRQLIRTNAGLRIEIGNYQKLIPADEREAAHYVSTPVYDIPHTKDLLKGKNRSNLTLLVFKLLYAVSPEAPLISDFKIVCDTLNPKFRAIDYGMLLNEAHQPSTAMRHHERSDFYLQRLKATTVLLHYLMTHQATNSVRRLHQAFFQHFNQTIQQDQQLREEDKASLLQMINLCYGYTVLSDKELAKSGVGLFAQGPMQMNNMLNLLKQPLEKEFLYAPADDLDSRYLNKQVSKVIAACHDGYVQAVAGLQKTGEAETGAYKKLIQFSEQSGMGMHKPPEP